MFRPDRPVPGPVISAYGQEPPVTVLNRAKRVVLWTFSLHRLWPRNAFRRPSLWRIGSVAFAVLAAVTAFIGPNNSISFYGVEAPWLMRGAFLAVVAITLITLLPKCRCSLSWRYTAVVVTGGVFMGRAVSLIGFTPALSWTTRIVGGVAWAVFAYVAAEHHAGAHEAETKYALEDL